ncbi:MAG TPA: hypothetical protein VMF32_11685 [Xanthobacteraceae bacterium]|nr:hypothetical protein [Xanthobacteraceae bacterium]
MRRISSKWTFFYKSVFPIFWFGFIILFLVVALFVPMRSGQSPPIPALIVPAIMFVVGFFLMKKFVFDLADEVWEDNDVLIVKNRGQEQRIALRDIKNVSYSPMMSPPRVVLSLRRPTVFGGQIAFCAPVRFVPFATSPIIDDLIDRIDAARQGQA